MDTKLKRSKKIRSLIYRAVAVGALFTAVFSGIMGREALVNLSQTGSNALSGDIYYLSDFREYMTTLCFQSVVGYAGVGDDNGNPLDTEESARIAQICRSDFRTTINNAAEKDIIYYLDQEGQILEEGNNDYPLFSSYDGHLMIPEDVKLCLYWDGPGNTLYYFGSSYNLQYPSQLLTLSSDVKYLPNMEAAADLRMILAVRDTDFYNSTRVYRFDQLAKTYQLALIVFLSSISMFLLFTLLSLLSHKAAKLMWKDYADFALKIWLEWKLLLIGLAIYLCASHKLWDFTAAQHIRSNCYASMWIYFPVGILLFLVCKDLLLNKAESWTHSFVGSIIRFVKKFILGIRWYRKVMCLCIATLLGSLVMICTGILLLSFGYIDTYCAPATTKHAATCMGWVVFFPGILLLISFVRLSHFTMDVNTICSKLSELRNGASHSPVVLPGKSLLCHAAEDLNALEDGIEAAVEQENRSNRMRVELITNVSHDLKTPLTSIINYADLLCEEKLPEPAAEYASALQAKAYRLNSMVQDVFELSKATSGNLTIEKNVLDLAKLLKQTLADMDERISDSTLTFKLNIATEPIMIEADGEKLYRIFQNLIVNALQYSLENSRVHIQLFIEDGFAHAKVKNTSREELNFDPAEIVERFVRADSSRTTEGSGLGLSIVQSFTEACGGTFHITTDADMFTACVSFPLAEIPTPSHAEQPEEGPDHDNENK